jgi:hypothetical protein
MFVDFNAVFYPENLLVNVRLTDICPCNDCTVNEEYRIKKLYGSIAERQYASLPEYCDTCRKRISWFTKCLQKLEWYERNDERLKPKG